MDYTVKKGDTLWDISKRFYGDPFLWPRLWQQNQYITNPHHIEPGDPIRLYPYKVLIEVEGKKPPEEVVKPLLPPQLEEAPPSLPPVPEIIRLTIYPEVNSAGFITDKMEGVGRIVGVKKEVDISELAAEDEIYINFKNGFSINKGDAFTIFRVGEPIMHPVTKKVIGRKVLVLGTAVITKTAEGTAQTAMITHSFDAIANGDEVAPYSVLREELSVKTMEERLDGWVVASQVSKLELAEGDVVYIDRGENDHVQPGHIFNVLRMGAIAIEPASKKKVQLPNEPIARLVVLQTQPKTSTALIIQSRISAQIGDRITNITE
jgi:hypothetical protein